MKTVFLSLGSNLGDRAKKMHEAIALLKQLEKTDVVQESKIYETEPWGKTDQPHFLNQIVVLKTELSPEDLLDAILSIESQLGRVRNERWGARTIDIDILVCEGEVRNSERLVLPHPYMLERIFVLEPLAEIAPDLKVKGKRIAEYLSEAKRKQEGS